MTLTPNALKEIETEIIKNAQNGTDDMVIEADHTAENVWDFDSAVWDTYKLLFKGKTIVDFQVSSHNGNIDSRKTKLFIGNKQIKDLNINTISELLNAFESIYRQQLKTKYERRKKIEEEEKHKKVVKPELNTTTIFTMINEKIKVIER